ncbi:6-N-hydroxylaminopurine resistance protein [Anatilimnocola aggregata]|uniref:6-N-hydroxylaminopurine resistance protein n=1 Tax=Anatilimnocola aggregata TaxID=2528021 RepID=A0A517YI15_9BACT|nr:MOSC domain-containing protein [Anatilimnocola aggregata]QDU29877.1 6-N-hydroxylaminopurine resistance protein [Anatilimnocola aggregata]
MATLRSIQVALPQNYGNAGAHDEHDRPWTTAFFKLPVTGPQQVGELGIAGDGQADLRFHGGPDKAVLAYSADHFPRWQTEIPHIKWTWGAFGENLTIEGCDETNVCIGDVWQLGGVQFEVSQPRQPCWKLSRRWRISDLARQVTHNGRSGWYVRVLQPGEIEAGQEVLLLSRPFPEWTVARASQIMHHEKQNLAAAEELSNLPQLAESWRETFRERVAKRRSH